MLPQDQSSHPHTFAVPAPRKVPAGNDLKVNVVPSPSSPLSDTAPSLDSMAAPQALPASSSTALLSTAEEGLKSTPVSLGSDIMRSHIKPTVLEQPGSTQQPPPLPYKVPSWSKIPSEDYFFEVIKNGSIVEQTPLFRQEHIVVGRLPICDVGLEHQSISRYHAVIQFKHDDTVYIYDLGSSHGTYLNKMLLPKKEYVQLCVGDMIRFGQSSRIHILMGPEPAISEVEFKTSLKPKKSADIAVDSAADGVTWGFAEDAYEGDEFAGQDIDMSSIDRSTIDPNAFYYSDPRKALRVWFDARGADMTYHFEEEGHGVTRGYVARIDLPVETGMGKLFGVGHGSRKRSAETDAALEACAKLDKHGLLSCSGAETTQKIKNRMKELYGDDNDEDSFYDRTSKVNQLKSKLALQNENPETLESLELKRTHTLGEIERLQKVISKADKDAIQAVEEIDELDQFMSQVNSSIQSESITANRKSLNEFEAEVVRLDKLIKLVRTTDLSLSSNPTTAPDFSGKRSTSPPKTSKTLTVPSVSLVRPEKPKTMVSICSFINELATTKASAEISSDEAVPTKAIQAAPLEKRSLDAEKADDEPAKPHATDFSNSNKKRKFLVPTQEQMQHHNIETEDVVDSIVDNSADQAEIAKMNATYGY